MKQRRLKLNLCFVCVALTLLLMACGSKPTEPAPTPTATRRVELTISGSGTASTILEGIKPAFEAAVPGYTLEILPGTGTGEGVKGALQGVFDVAAMARPPKDEEVAAGIEYTEFGQSGVAVFAHPGVGVANLTTAQVKALFAGEIANWSAVGGPDLPVVLYVRDEGDSSTQSLRKVVFGDTAFPEFAQVLTSQTDMQAAVAGTPGGVGFGSWPSVLAMRANVKPITLDGVAPGDAAYPMFGPVGIGYLSTRKADVQPLVDWLTSEQGQKALAEFDVILTSP
ncbi:MAG: substrate-binding domain-containing protein [Anaerolineae bacterium]